jgi:hypothetical protein
MRYYPNEVSDPGPASCFWLVFSLAAGFAHAAGATELDIDYLRGSTAPSELTTTSRCPRCPREVAAHDRYWGD